jgi:anthranilate phosphoribosyltransferase
MFALLLEKLGRRHDLTPDEAGMAMVAITEGRATSAQTAGLLVALAMKGEHPAEIVGFARALRARAMKLSRPFDGVLDMCGTGGDKTGTFNISSVAAVVAASCGATVAKHGNRAVSSACGSADVFEVLGVRTTLAPSIVERSLERAGIAFLFAPVFHPSMRQAALVRMELGIRTAFNLLGPLTNPVGPTRQVVGVARPELTELVARALMMLGCERGWVVHGADGLDEISTTGYTKVSECRDGAVRTFYVHPSEFGISTASPIDLAGGDSRANAGIALDVLGGRKGPARDITLLNAGVGLFIARLARDVREGIARAAEAIDRGDAMTTLDRMRAISQEDGASMALNRAELRQAGLT